MSQATLGADRAVPEATPLRTRARRTVLRFIFMTGGIAVVLGDTGRNFAAGMSGGVAYVYDADGRFRERCNTAQVDIEEIGAVDPSESSDRPRQRSISAENSGMGDMLGFDAERLRILIERHQLFTGSARARELLEDWANTPARFVKVMPRDYRRALLALKAERQAAAE